MKSAPRWLPKFCAGVLSASVSAGLASDLPSRVDHSRSPYFPPIVKQRYQSCSQEAAIYYVLSYEWNRQRNIRARLPENQLAPGFAWRFLNLGQDTGSELAEGWEIAKRMGVPSMSEWERDTPGLDAWMHGYERYLQAMKRRVIQYQFNPLTDESELEQLKIWLAWHGGSGTRAGGVAAFEQRLRGAQFGTADRGETIVTAWGSHGPGHVMTYVGYDDHLCVDRNGDDRFTRDEDIDGNGVVNLGDSEYGALLAVNSFGTGWGDGGKVWVPYHLVAENPFRRGRWYATADVASGYEPTWTLKLQFASPNRSAFRLWLLDPGGGRHDVFPFLTEFDTAHGANLTSPEKYSSFVTGKLRLGDLPPCGRHDDSPIEMGFDLTGILHGDARTWRVGVQSMGGATGEIYEACFFRYESGTKVPVEQIDLGTFPLRFGESAKVVGVVDQAGGG